MYMKKIFSILFIVILSIGSLKAQVFQGINADKIVKGAQIVKVSSDESLPTFIKFFPGKEPSFSNLKTWINEIYKTNDQMSIIQIGKETDNLGFTHYRYQQTYNGIPVHEAQFIVHVINNKIASVNGRIYNNIVLKNTEMLTKKQMIASALSYVNASQYKWENAGEEKWLKNTTNNPQATYYPAGKMEIVLSESDKSFHLACKFDIYATQPLSRQDVYIDAATGKVIKSLNHLFTTDVQGTAVTKYSGTKTFTTDSIAASQYRLRETGRGNGINTYNMLTNTDYATAVDFTDTDNNWNNVNSNQDEIATDAHWGAEMTYDYYFTKHSRNSIDGNGFALNSYVHYDVGYDNAFWDGQVMTYGDGDGSTYTPFTALDICGHEITHGLDSYTANLDYAGESGAMNEGFSDIFGTAIEFFGKPTMANWTCGEDIGTVIRNLGNPNATSNPDTYLGTNWDPQQEVHQNSTVISYWFYLVSQGGSGTNDIGNAFNVTGIGIDKASDVAFRMLTVYLINSSNYSDARFCAIQAATDLFGGCSPEVETVTNAMYAVGIGSSYVPEVVVDFTSSNHVSCSVPFTVDFSNMSTNASSFIWNFGDGTTSTSSNPTHVYTTMGNFNVTLIGTSLGCGSDTLMQTAFVSVSDVNSNVASIPSTGSVDPLTCCTGTLYDSGGSGDYASNTDGSITIAPLGAATVKLTFSSFNFESGYDYLYIYDGPDASSALIGQYDGTTLPGSGEILSTTGSITLRQTSDVGVVASGFALTWQCNLPNVPPDVNFSVSSTNSCSGVINFHDLSINGPSSWLWDFGDGTTSTSQNPTHAYTSDGIYTISLHATNFLGADSLIQTNYITVSMPDAPSVVPASGCDSGTVALSATGIGQLDWYNAAIGGNFLYTGSPYTTPVLYATTTFYVEDKVLQASEYGGKTDNTGAGGNYNNTSTFHYEIFDCYQPLKLTSVKVYATGAGNRTIQLRNSAQTVLQTLTVNIPDGESRVTLDFDVPVGNDLQLVCSTAANLFRNNSSSATYPYTIPGKLSITESSASLTSNVFGNYYFFYDWEVKPYCTSPRVPVIATVLPCNGIEENMGANIFSVYPNPAEDLVNIIFEKGNGLYNIVFTDIIGKVIYSSEYRSSTTKNETSINTSEFAPGVYFVKVSTNEQQTILKVIIK
jgi:Zn-dependent metalloprotease